MLRLPRQGKISVTAITFWSFSTQRGLRVKRLIGIFAVSAASIWLAWYLDRKKAL
jgi:hypothetical protein